ncbi:MAG: response regulator transcription factor [Phycisphaerales bacterium]
MTNQYEDPYSVISQETGAAVKVFDRDGKILYFNAEAIRICLPDMAHESEVIGRRIDELGLPQSWVDERLKLIQRATDQKQEFMFRAIWLGHQQFSWVRSLGVEEGELPRALFITRRIPAGEEADHLHDTELQVIDSEFAELGELEIISKRELEVLALIGQGLTAKEIAELLYRSPKTIEHHRSSLGLKLNETNRIELAMIAREAGLSVVDADRIRISLRVPETI